MRKTILRETYVHKKCISRLICSKISICRYIRGIKPKRIKSGVAHLHGLATGLYSSEQTTQRRQAADNGAGLYIRRNKFDVRRLGVTDSSLGRIDVRVRVILGLESQRRVVSCPIVAYCVDNTVSNLIGPQSNPRPTAPFAVSLTKNQSSNL